MACWFKSAKWLYEAAGTEMKLTQNVGGGGVRPARASYSSLAGSASEGDFQGKSKPWLCLLSKEIA